MAQPDSPGDVLSFITDDMIAAQLRQIANGLAHLEAMIPSMRRQVETLEQQIRPKT